MARRSPARVGRNGRPSLRALEELVRIPERSPLASDLRRALRAASRLHLLRSDLEPVPVQPTATTSEAGAYRYREADPVDLRISRRGGRVVVGFLHELGHFVDHQAWYDPHTRAWASDAHPAFAPWRAAAFKLAGASIEHATTRHYFGSTRELWARSYAQTVLMLSSDPALEGLLEQLQAARDVYVWPAAHFAPVAAEVEATLERLGLGWQQTQLAA